MMDWIRVLSETFHSACQRCGHLSVYAVDGIDRCWWPECSWPDAVREHVAGFFVNPDGSVTICFVRG